MKGLVKYLHSIGHSCMAYVTYPLRLRPTEARRTAFLEAMAHYGALAKVVNPHSEGFMAGRDATRELLRSDFKPTAILCVNDITAVGVLKELWDQGISVPNQMSVAGFDNINLAQFTSPALTTMHIPRDRIGELAFEGLFSTLPGGGASAHEINIDVELIVRQSTGTAPDVPSRG
jgi:DNA-binding LacI/PurR family transcriptional regulator